MADKKIHPALEKKVRGRVSKETKTMRIESALKFLNEHPQATKLELVRFLVETEGATKAAAYQIVAAARRAVEAKA